MSGGCPLHGPVWCTCPSPASYAEQLAKAREEGRKLAEELRPAMKAAEAKPVRLAQGLTDPVPRAWKPQEQYMLYMDGWRDGASMHSIRKDREGLPWYDRGYQDGRADMKQAAVKFAQEIGYVPSILRLGVVPPEETKAEEKSSEPDRSKKNRKKTDGR